MLMHDHSGAAKAEDEFCPIMKEICHGGWTESMGEMANKRRPKCKAWQPVTVVDPTAKPPQHDVYDCAVFGWTPDLIVQAANEAYHGAQAVEQVRNQVAEQNGSAKIMLAFFQGIAKRMRATVFLPPMMPKGRDVPVLPTAPSENGKGE